MSVAMWIGCGSGRLVSGLQAGQAEGLDLSGGSWDGMGWGQEAGGDLFGISRIPGMLTAGEEEKQI